MEGVTGETGVAGQTVLNKFIWVPITEELSLSSTIFVLPPPPTICQGKKFRNGAWTNEAQLEQVQWDGREGLQRSSKVAESNVDEEKTENVLLKKS